MENFDKTMKFSYDDIPKEDVKSVLQNVMEELVSNYLKEHSEV